MGAAMKLRFAAFFSVTFTLLMVLWWAVDVAQFYRNAVLLVAQAVSPLINGWFLEHDRPGLVNEVVFRSGDRQLAMLLQLPALSMGLVPLLSLIMATPGMTMGRAAVRAALGAVLYFLLDTVVVLTYPFIMDHPNVVKDTLGVFTGLIAFVVAPLALWFVLTYPALRSTWRITPPSSPQGLKPSSVAHP
jgi:hypothetical protein